MVKKSSILLYVLLAVLAISALYKYYVFLVERDYIITSEISCDPKVESCFVWDCSIEEDEECDQSPYKYISKNAKYAEVCDLYKSDDCSELVCEYGEPQCEIILCSEDTLGEEEFCLFEPEVAEIEAIIIEKEDELNGGQESEIITETEE